MVKINKTNLERSSHLYGLDYLRVILCISVIALHTNIFSVSSPYNEIDSANPLYYFFCCV